MTLTGAPGAGKTRLALELANELAELGEEAFTAAHESGGRLSLEEAAAEASGQP